MNLLTNIRDKLDDLSRSERKVAQIILDDPAQAIRYSMARLAAAADVSDPTVNRFCRNLECNGFSDFKLRLAQELGASTSSIYASRNAGLYDQADEIAGKVFEATMATVANAWAAIDSVKLERAIDALAQARKIQIFAFGDYLPVAHAALQQMQYLGATTDMAIDPVSQQLAAKNLHPGDVVIVLSQQGTHPVLLGSVRMAIKSGATVLSITQNNSELAQISHISLPADSCDQNNLLSPATPGIIAQTWIFSLLKGVVLRRGPGYLEHIKSLIDNTCY